MLGDEEDWNLDGIMTAEEAKASELHGRIRALQEKCCSSSVEAPTDVLSLELERR